MPPGSDEEPDELYREFEDEPGYQFSYRPDNGINMVVTDGSKD